MYDNKSAEETIKMLSTFILEENIFEHVTTILICQGIVFLNCIIGLILFKKCIYHKITYKFQKYNLVIFSFILVFCLVWSMVNLVFNNNIQENNSQLISIIQGNTVKSNIKFNNIFGFLLNQESADFVFTESGCSDSITNQFLKTIYNIYNFAFVCKSFFPFLLFFYLN